MRGGEAGHEEVEPREGHHVHGQLAQVGVQLAGEPTNTVTDVINTVTDVINTVTDVMNTVTDAIRSIKSHGREGLENVTAVNHSKFNAKIYI